MNREIKFRSFNKKVNFISEGKSLKEITEIQSIDWNNIIIMQYTGLKDKNGIEVYEGDIYQDRIGSIFIVEFTKGSFFIRKHYDYWLEKIVYDRNVFFTIDSFLLGDVKNCGNIFENNKLLKI